MVWAGFVLFRLRRGLCTNLARSDMKPQPTSPILKLRSDPKSRTNLKLRLDLKLRPDPKLRTDLKLRTDPKLRTDLKLRTDPK